MADSESRLFVSLILFWVGLTIFSSIFANYIDQPLSSNIGDYAPDNNQDVTQLNGWERFASGFYNTLSEIPIINVFIPLVKLLTFGYSSTIPPLITMFLQGVMILTYYVIWRTFK